MIQLRAGFSMEPNERTPAIKRQSQCKAPHQQASHPHACQGIAGRGDEPNVWDRKCWRVKRGRSQPWTKAPRAEARRFPVNCSGPGHERTGGEPAGGWGGGGTEAQSLLALPWGGEAEAASFSPGTMTEDALGHQTRALQPASSSATGPWHAPEHQRPQKHPHFTLSTQDSVSSQYHLIFKSCRSKTYYILPLISTCDWFFWLR